MPTHQESHTSDDATDKLIKEFYQEPLFTGCEIQIHKVSPDIYKCSLMSANGQRVMCSSHAHTLNDSISRMFRLLGYHETYKNYKDLESKAVEKMPFLVGKTELMEQYTNLLEKVPDDAEKVRLRASFFWSINKVIKGIDYLEKKYFSNDAHNCK